MLIVKQEMIYRKNMRYLFLSLIVLGMIGCGSTAPVRRADKTYTVANAKYEISLSSVERTVGAEKISIEQRIETVLEDGISSSSFEDQTVTIKWTPTPYDIGFALTNKTDQPIGVVWNESRFIDEKGTSHRVTHVGIGFEDRDNFHPSTVIGPRGAIKDFVHPADYFKWEELGGGKSNKEQGYGKRTPFLPIQIKGKAEELKAKVEPFVGKTFQVILVLQIGDVRNDYISTFKIDDVTITEKEEHQEKNPNEGKGSGGGKGGRRRGY